MFRKKLSRPQFARFMAEQPPCLVAMEACASAHHWAREMSRYGHEVRLIAPHYVKPFLKRQKNDAADAEAIVEAALRPTLRFVEPKSADRQARAVATETSPPGLAWCRGSMRPAASRSWPRPRRWGNVTSGDCWSSGRLP